MPHIVLPPHKPGMVALAAYRPDVYTRLASLADLLLQEENPEGTLSLGERELIATHVSILNNCAYCQAAHGSIACAHLQDPKLVSAIKADPETSELISPKIKALLRIAGMVTKSGKEVSEEAVESARKEGATEMDVHDTVLIAAMFCMFNRYVDGLGTEMPGNLRVFEGRGKVIAERGYGIPVPVESRKDGEPS